VYRVSQQYVCLAVYICILSFKSYVTVVVVHRCFSPEENRAAGDLEALFADSSAQSSGTRPGREEAVPGDAANDLKARQRIADVIPEADGDHEVKLPVRLPILNVAENKVAALEDTVFAHQGFGKLP